MRVSLSLWVAVLCTLAPVHGGDEARLLASKNLLNTYAVEGRDLTVQFNIYNVGSSAALDVELVDESFSPEDFGIVSGALTAKWERIAPTKRRHKAYNSTTAHYQSIENSGSSNVTHAVVLRPLKPGYVNFTAATVSYLPHEGSSVMVGFTSAPGQGSILAQREFDRRFSAHYLDWMAFAVMTLPSVGVPLLLWYSSKSKYDAPKAKTK